ncbi:MAG: hypothetical protein EAZ36_07155 [Verrucomicrobia bacterium]|nr:MAG: hypothetical protein EAZ36_07155 [Verrucomicrobiota bacterium]
MDFQVSGANALEMCDPSRPQFIPVVAARSPVRMELRSANGQAAQAGLTTAFVLTLATSSGRPIGPVDLAIVHTRKLHLLVIDPTLRDYQHLHPEPGEKPGEWTFTHTPRLVGDYRVFADFTPLATGRGLYSFADYVVNPTNLDQRLGENTLSPPIRLREDAVIADWRFRLTTQGGGPVKAGQPSTLVFDGREIAGGKVPMSLVMDAYAHLVAFDAQRSGFAHLHPRGEVPGDYAVAAPHPSEPRLYFDLTIPEAGSYLVWAQVNLAGGEYFLPFTLEVLP